MKQQYILRPAVSARFSHPISCASEEHKRARYVILSVFSFPKESLS